MTTTTLVRFQLGRERTLLPVWILGIVALFTASGLAITREFGDEQARAAVVVLAAGNPAFLFLRGLPDGTGAGALAFFQTFRSTPSIGRRLPSRSSRGPSRT